ncbi:thioesterase domain-containing protein [Streptomyces sp. PmtG]
MGAALAWETALRLEALPGLPPRRVYVSGRPGPRHQHPGTMHQLPEEEFVKEIQRLGGTEPELLKDPDLRSLVLPAIRADYRLIETYRPDPNARLRCPIGVFTGDQDYEVTPEGVDSWREASHGAFSSEVLPGDHFYLTEHAEHIVSAMFNMGTGTGTGTGSAHGAVRPMRRPPATRAARRAPDAPSAGTATPPRGHAKAPRGPGHPSCRPHVTGVRATGLGGRGGGSRPLGPRGAGELAVGEVGEHARHERRRGLRPGRRTDALHPTAVRADGNVVRHVRHYAHPKSRFR